MKTTFYLNVYSDYYLYDDGTETYKTATMKWDEEKEFPLLQAGVQVRLGKNTYAVKTVIADDESGQTIICRVNIGYNRYRNIQLEKLAEKGWILEKEYNAR